MPKHLQADLILNVAQASDKGVEKSENEDAMGMRIPDGELLIMKGVVALVADGVSTAEAGKEASEICVDRFIADYFSTPDTWTVPSSAQKVLTSINSWLYSRGHQYLEASRGFISTLSALVIKSNVAHIFHVGDSRIYRLRGQDFEQLSVDHVANLTGEKNHLTRAMGMSAKLEVDYRRTDVQQGDLFFLSTDGVHDFVDESVISATLLKSMDYNKSCDELIGVAIKNGSQDNITCQVISVESVPEAGKEEVCRALGELVFPPDLEVGVKLDGYRVVKLIHASNRSQVYKVIDEIDDKFYILKTPSVNYEDDFSYIERFVMEPWIGRRLASEHIVKVVEKRASSKFLYYVTEYIEGETLGEWMQSNPSPKLKEVVSIAKQIIEGLKIFQYHQVIHQDIKPDNVMIDLDGNIKILDFGSCYVAGIHEISTPVARDVVLGTADYSAPEVVLQDYVSELADQFSLGSIIYEMLTGQLPYGRDMGVNSAKDLSKLNYVPAYQLNKRVPVWMDGAIHKAVKRRAIKRYKNLDDFYYDLTHPNWEYLKILHKPLVKRDPIKFWKRVFYIMVVVQSVFLFWIVLKNINIL